MSGRLAASLAPLGTSLAAVAAALVVGGLFLEARGKDALAAYRLLWERGLASPSGLSGTLVQTAPLLLVGAGLLVALRAGVWNIGVDGQVLVGALGAAVVAARLAGDVPSAVLLLAGAAAGLAGGVAWATVPAVLRVRYGLNEIVSTLMLNYVAINLTSYLVKGPLKDPEVVPPQTALIPRADRLPDLPGTEVHVGLLAGLVAVGLVGAVYGRTVLGFRLRALGLNRRAAAHAGMPVGRLTALALLASGGCAGLAGANDVLGVQGLFRGNWDPGYGLAGFAVVYLARLSALWTVPFAAFLAFLAVGGERITRPTGVPTAFVPLLEGLMLVALAAAAPLGRAISALGRARRARPASVARPADALADPGLADPGVPGPRGAA